MNSVQVWEITPLEFSLFKTGWRMTQLKRWFDTSNRLRRPCSVEKSFEPGSPAAGLMAISRTKPTGGKFYRAGGVFEWRLPLNLSQSQ